jgi:hypothetical protein
VVPAGEKRRARRVAVVWEVTPMSSSPNRSRRAPKVVGAARGGAAPRAYSLQSPTVVGGLAQGPANILQAALHGRGGRAMSARILIGVLMGIIVLMIIAGLFVH